ncbi:hypothetical protein CANARDRAFT_28210 [[Candida] arabinofermentans NRRL YB-2248]|uniref:Nucleolar 27S pre-rRNA processing Urb2/Npa2 C-terminal domain-containing protein n=1 Tax=[Candida] arabinofermentans NRRL YB-2248 TaxID=983967 RepID=A0A1E4T129_9ASCO|nr:hypothetical protein CANARDRAFT_28210 [[Candida] arabinofermentans NRRL YB-2248]
MPSQVKMSGDLALKFDSTEKITRFLRNQSTAIDQIYNLSCNLLDDNSELSLPSKEKFIFELVCDRLSQQKSAQFKTNKLTWQLFYKTWMKFNGNKTLIQTRTKIANNLKFSDIIVSTLAEIESKELSHDEELIESFTDCVQLGLEHLKLIFTNDQSVKAISDFLSIAVTNKQQYPQELINKLVSVAIQIFKSSNTTTVKYNKKSVSSFCSTCLPNLLNLQHDYIEMKTGEKDQLEGIDSIIKEVLFRKENIGNLEENIGFFVQKSHLQKSVSSDSIVLLFKMIIPKVDIKELEKIFTEITSKFPETSGSLLKEITSMNKSLSTDFLTPLVELSLAQPIIDYSVIIQSIERNSEVGLNFADKIFTSLSSSSSTVSMPLLVSLFQCYVRSREIPLFFQIWKKHIIACDSDSSIIISDRFLSEVSKHVITSSQSQPIELAEVIIGGLQDDVKCNSILLTSLLLALLEGVTGAENSARNKLLLSTIESLKSLFVDVLKIEKYNDYLWKVKALILMLYNWNDVQESVDYTKYIALEVYDSPSYYPAVFRVLEQQPQLSTSLLTSNFVKYFENSSLDFKTLIFDRWFVLLNSILTTEQLATVVSSVFESNIELLQKILSNGFIHEQQNLIHQMIVCLKLKLKNGQVEFIELIDMVPVQCFKKHQREELLDLLYTVSVDSKVTPTIHRQARDSIMHLLFQPTYKSKIETDMSAILEFVESSNSPAVLAESLKIVEYICVLHLKQLNDKSNSQLIQSSLETLNSKIPKVKSSSTIKNSGILNFALCLIKTYRQLKNADTDSIDKEFNKLIEKMGNLCSKLLLKNKSLDSASICWLLNTVAELKTWDDECISDSSCRTIIKTLGGSYQSDPIIQDSLFKVVSRLHKSYSASFVLALFINLETSKETIESLNFYLSKLAETNQESYYSSWDNLISSFENVGAEVSIIPYVQLLGSLLINTQKVDSDMLRKPLHCTIASLSAFINIENSKLTSDLEGLLGFVTKIKSLIANKNWCLNQYAVELIISFVNKISKIILGLQSSSVKSPEVVVELYLQLTQVVSNVLLFQRYRFSNRQHLLISTFVSLMECLFDKGNNKSISYAAISSSKEAGLAFHRLMSNLCEPSSSSISNQYHDVNNSSKDTSITTALSIVKSQLRKSTPVLVFNYLRFYLQYSMTPEVKESINNSIFLIFDLLTANELNYINASIDSQSRVVFKNIYDDYKKFGKWKGE